MYRCRIDTTSTLYRTVSVLHRKQHRSYIDGRPMHNMHSIDDTSNMVIITDHRACSTLSCIEHKCIIDHRGRSTVYSAITTTIMGHLTWSSPSIIIGHILSIHHQSSMIMLHDRSSLYMIDDYRAWWSYSMSQNDDPVRWSPNRMTIEADHQHH